MKRLALLMVLIMALSTAAACTGQAEQTAQPEQAAQTEQTEQTAASPSPASASPSPTSEDSETADTNEPVTITIYNNSGGGTSASGEASDPAALQAMHDYILEQTGFDVTSIIPVAGTEAEKLNTMLASKQKVDLFWGSWMEYKDIIQPISDAMDQYGGDIFSRWSEEAFAGLRDKDGVLWATPRNVPTTANPIHVRTDWLEKVGMAYPTNVDELEAVLQAFKDQDVAGNGQTVPLGLDQPGMRNALSAGFTGKGYGYYLDTDGLMKPVQLHPGYEDFVAKMADWYSRGLIYNEAFTSNRARYNELIVQGNFGAFAYWYSLISIVSPTLTANQPGAVYEYSRPFSGPAGFAETHGATSASGGLAPNYSSKVNEVIQYVNWSNESMDNAAISLYGLKDVHWKYVDEANGKIELTDGKRIYFGDLLSSLGLPLETAVSLEDPTQVLHNDWLRNRLLDFDETVGADDWDIVYDSNRTTENVPEKGDVDRMMNEQEVLFITGVRPMSEWGAFIDELYAIGMDKVIEDRTAQYNELKG